MTADSAPAQAIEGQRVSTLELFFDLVFVFTITQMTTLVARDQTLRGVVQATLMLGVIWWMYAGYAWLTNAVSPDRGSRRALLLGGMAAFLVLALAIPHAFGDSAIAFGIAYAVVVAVHAALYSRTDSEATVRSVAGLERFNAVGVMLVLVGGVIGGPAQYALWAAAFAWEWITPRLIDDSGFLIGAAHLVERHGLVVIVAIGESVVAIGIGASGRPVDLPLALVSVLGLLLSACLWWSYFDGDDAEAERALAEAPQARRPRLAVDAFGLWHLPLLGGIVAIAAALREATGRGYGTGGTGEALILAGGVTVFLLGDAGFRATLSLGARRWRLLAAVLAPATIPLGLGVAVVAQVGALVVVLGGSLVAERAAASVGHATSLGP